MAQATSSAEPTGELTGKNEKRSSAKVVDVEGDEELRGLDPVEQKMVLVNRVINSQGMGRYQVGISSQLPVGSYTLPSPPKACLSVPQLDLIKFATLHIVVPVRFDRIWLLFGLGICATFWIDYHTFECRT